MQFKERDIHYNWNILHKGDAGYMNFAASSAPLSQKALLGNKYASNTQLHFTTN